MNGYPAVEETEKLMPETKPDSPAPSESSESSKSTSTSQQSISSDPGVMSHNLQQVKLQHYPKPVAENWDIEFSWITMRPFWNDSMAEAR